MCKTTATFYINARGENQTWINKWDDTTRYNVVYNSSTRRNQNKLLKQRSFKGILQFYKDCYDREQITISPKPDLPRLRFPGTHI